jgi:NAD(P)-dependent dehydrogenase (short-subunit alcohol dehydrogenase family)
MAGKLDWRAEYEGKTVCVIGGTSGIGKAIAGAFGGSRAKLFVTGSNENSVRSAKEKDSRARFDVLDIRNGDAIVAYCRTFKEMHVLVNTVGVSFAFQELEPENLTDVLEINLAGVARLCAAMHPALKQAKGAVVNFASMTSFLGSASNPIYSAAKGGIAQLTKSFASAWGKEGIRVNAIAPGYIRTRLTARRWKEETNSRTIAERTPLGRWGEPEDIVGPTLFLGSSAAAFVTGTVFPVDGGFLIA